MKTTAAAAEKLHGPPEFFSPDVAQARRFYLNLAPARKTPLAVVCGGREYCTPDYSIHRSSFSYYSIEFVASGRGTVKLRGREHTLQAGKMFCYGPKVRHDIATDSAAPLVKYFVDFTGTKALSLLTNAGFEPGQAWQVVAPGEVQTIFDELINNGLRATRYSGEICVQLLECLALKSAELSAPKEGAESAAFIAFEKCRRFIQQNYERLRTLEQIANECQSGFSDPFHFSCAFKNTLGLSPAAFRRLRG